MFISRSKHIILKDYKQYIIFFLILLTYFILFQPVVHGDSSSYLKLAKEFSGYPLNYYSGHRSPLYPLILSLFIRIIAEKNLLITILIFQYFILFFSALLLYKITKKIITNSSLCFLTSILFLINPSTIYYSYMVLTETLTVFLFLLTIYFTINLVNEHKIIYLLFSGISSGLLILARFNLLFLPFFILLILILYLLKNNKFSLRYLFRSFLIYTLPVIFILNLWALKNYTTFGEYFLLPSGGAIISRNALLITLDNNTKVDEKNKEIKEIFLASKNKILNKNLKLNKSSFLKYSNKLKNFVYRMNSGFIIYSDAFPEIKKYFGLNDSTSSILDVDDRLSSFYYNILWDNKFKMIIPMSYSFLISFKPTPSSPSCNANIGKFISKIWFLYKIVFIISMFLFMYLTIIKLLKIIKNKSVLDNLNIMSIIIAILYFPIVNFLFATMADANRYKFPSEPLIIMMLIYYYNIYKDSYIKRSAFVHKIIKGFGRLNVEG